MVWRLVSAIVLATAFNSGGAAAQGSDDPFCALAPFQMLAALDGTWSLTQEAGVAVGAGRRIPLPPNTQTFTIEFDPTIGIADLKGGSPPQTLALFPTNLTAVEEIIWFVIDIGEDDDGNQTERNLLETQLNAGSGCDFYSLPIMLGFNTYALTQPAEGLGAYSLEVAVGGNYATLCFSRSEVESNIDNLREGDLRRGVEVSGESAGEVTGAYFVETDQRDIESRRACNLDVPPPTPGTMVMSLVMKFHSANQGTGILQFEGEQGGHKFFARAPVTMSR